MTTSCSKCGGPGPFYASQPARSYCIPCHLAVARTRYAQQHTAILAAARALRLRRVLATPVHLRTRRQHKRLLDAEAPPGKKVCAYCWLAKWPAFFRLLARSGDGRDYYCRACRHMLDIGRHASRKKGTG
jgi:hypothetical protein